jgi:ABC-type transport system involved in multi-copper enzyme maturation permease subunit
MSNEIRSELLKLRTTRSVVVMVAGLVVVVGLGVVAIVTDSPARTLAHPLEQQAFLHVMSSIAPLFALLLGIRSFTDEFRFGSIVPTLLANPSRGHVLVAKLVGAAVGALALTVVAAATSLAIGVPLLLAQGIDVTWSAGAVAEVVGRLAAATVLWSAIGVGFGLAVRHQVAAIGGALVWMLAGEGILAGLMPNVARFFPGSAGFGLVGINPDEVLTPVPAALLLAGYAAVASVAGAALMRRRDVG